MSARNGKATRAKAALGTTWKGEKREGHSHRKMCRSPGDPRFSGAYRRAFNGCAGHSNRNHIVRLVLWKPLAGIVHTLTIIAHAWYVIDNCLICTNARGGEKSAKLSQTMNRKRSQADEKRYHMRPLHFGHSSSRHPTS